jgi:hypothetical protein
MKSLNPVLHVALIILLCLPAACVQNSAAVSGRAGGTGVEANKINIEYKVKEDALLKAPGAQAKPLELVRRIESELGGKDKFVFPASLSVSEDRRVYIADNNAHVIRYCSPDSDQVATLPIQDGQGKLAWPNWVASWKDSIIVTDNDGIKVFDSRGAFRRLLRVFYQINHLTVRADGTIFINPVFSKQKADNPLIVELDGTGKRVKGFGEWLNSPDGLGLANQVYLCASGEYVFAAFKHSPLVQIYNTRGELVRWFNVNHPAFADLAPLAQDKKFIHPEPNKYRLPNYLSGARLIGDRLFLLLDLPQPEVVEFDFQGQELSRYRANISPLARTYKDFDVQRAGDTYRFWMLVGDGEKFISLVEFSHSSED